MNFKDIDPTRLKVSEVWKFTSVLLHNVGCPVHTWWFFFFREIAYFPQGKGLQVSEVGAILTSMNDHYCEEKRNNEQKKIPLAWWPHLDYQKLMSIWCHLSCRNQQSVDEMPRIKKRKKKKITIINNNNNTICSLCFNIRLQCRCNF